MPRSKAPQLSENPFHITARSLNRENFKIPIDQVWEILSHEFWYCRHHYNLKLRSLVLMPNHFHALVNCSEVPMGKIMNHLMKETASEMNIRAGRINHVWGGPHWKTCISNHHHLINTYKYIYQNPVRAGLARRCEEWRFSSLHELLGLQKMQLPLESDEILFCPNFSEDELRWLNIPIEPDNLDAIKMALKKGLFKLPRKNGSLYNLNA